MSSTTVGLIVAAVAVLVVFVGAWWYLQKRRHRYLRERFGPEYDRTLNRTGDIRRAEADLAAREKRVARLHIRRLAPEEATRFAELWGHVQALFVDDPRGAVTEADRLVNEVMTARGYPVADFDRRIADISVDHPVVVEHYRAARAIVERHNRGETTTEDLRQAMVHCRALFDELLELKARENELTPEPARRES
jgi:hypothetical protein